MFGGRKGVATATRYVKLISSLSPKDEDFGTGFVDSGQRRQAELMLCLLVVALALGCSPWK